MSTTRRVRVAPLPPIARHVAAIVVIPVLTFGAMMVARQGDAALREEFTGRRAAQKEAFAHLAVALGPGGCAVIGLLGMGVAVPLLVLRLRRREAIRAAIRVALRRPERSENRFRTRQTARR